MRSPAIAVLAAVVVVACLGMAMYTLIQWSDARSCRERWPDYQTRSISSVGCQVNINGRFYMERAVRIEIQK